MRRAVKFQIAVPSIVECAVVSRYVSIPLWNYSTPISPIASLRSLGEETGETTSETVSVRVVL
jgi:hypothetical protein